MAGVGDEPPHPLLGAVRRRLGLLARVEGGLDLAQHDVQRPAEAADLGARVTLGHPPVKVAVGDVICGLLDVVQRSQVGPHRRDARHGEDEQDDGAHDQLDVGELRTVALMLPRSVPTMSVPFTCCVLPVLETA